MKRTTLLLTLLLALVAGQAWGAVKYVSSSASGSDDGTSATHTSGTTGPWTLAQGTASTPAAGDEIRIMADGVYSRANSWTCAWANGTAAANIKINGANASGTVDGTKATLQATTSSVTLLDVSGAHIRARYLICDGNSQTGSVGLQVTSGYSRATQCAGINCKTRGLGVDGYNATIDRCYATGCSGGIGIEAGWSSGGGHLLFCESYANSVTGIRFNTYGMIDSCLSYNNTGTASGFVGNSVGQVLSRCVAYGNAGHGFDLSGVFGYAGRLVNCISYGNTGMDYYTDAAKSGVWALNCAGRAGAANRNNGTGYDTADWVADQLEGYVTLAADPFVAGSTGNFALIATGAGASCRGAGFPGVTPSGHSTGYADIGAIQHQDAGAGNVIIVEDSMMPLAIVLLMSSIGLWWQRRRAKRLLAVAVLVALLCGPSFGASPTRFVPAGTTSYNVAVKMRSSTTAQYLSNCSGSVTTYSYLTDAGGTGTGTCVAGTLTTYTSGGFVESGATGQYIFSVPNAWLASVGGITVKLSSSGAIDAGVDIQVYSATQGLSGSGPTVVPSGGTVSNVTNAVVLPGTINVTGGTVSTVSGNVVGSVGSVAGGSVTLNANQHVIVDSGTITGGTLTDKAGFSGTMTVADKTGFSLSSSTGWGGSALSTAFPSGGTATVNVVQWGGAALPTAFGVTGTASANVVQWGGSALPTAFACSDKTGFALSATTGWGGSGLPTSFASSGTGTVNVVQWGGAGLPTSFAVSDKTGFSGTMSVSGTPSVNVTQWAGGTMPTAFAANNLPGDYARRTGDYSTLTQSQITGGAYDLTNATYIAALKAGLGTMPASGTMTVADKTGFGLSSTIGWGGSALPTAFNVSGTAPVNVVQWSSGALPTFPATWPASWPANWSWSTYAGGSISGITGVTFPASVMAAGTVSLGGTQSALLSSAGSGTWYSAPTAMTASNMPSDGNFLSTAQKASLTAAGSGAWYSAPTFPSDYQQRGVAVTLPSAPAGYGGGTVTEATISSLLSSVHGTGSWGGGAGTMSESTIDALLTANHGANSWTTGTASGGLTVPEHDWLLGIPQAPLLAADTRLPATMIAAKADVTAYAGSGNRIVIVTVTDGTNPLEGAKVRMTNGTDSPIVTTGVAGTCSLTLNDLTYAVGITHGGYQFAPTTLLINGNTGITYAMTPIVIPSSDPTHCTLYTTVYDSAGNPLAGKVIYLQLQAGPTAGVAYDITQRTATSDANGNVSFTNCWPGGRYAAWRGTVTPISRVFTVPASQTAPYPIPALQGQ